MLTHLVKVKRFLEFSVFLDKKKISDQIEKNSKVRWSILSLSQDKSMQIKMKNSLMIKTETKVN